MNDRRRRFAALILALLAACGMSEKGRAESPTAAVDSPFIRVDGEEQAEPTVSLRFREGHYEMMRNASFQSNQLIIRGVPLLHRRVDLKLQPVRVTSDGFQADVVGPGSRRFVAPRVLAWRGVIPGESSYVFLVISPTQANGYILDGLGRTIILSSGDPRRRDGRLTLADAADLHRRPNPAPWICGTPAGIEAALPLAEEASGPSPEGPRVQIFDVFIEADQHYRALFDSAEDAVDYVVTLMTAVSDIYRRDVGAVLRIPDGYLRLWETVPAWGEDDGGFMEYWRSEENPLHDIPRGAVHLLTAPVFGGYAAAFGGMCSPETGYDVSSVYGFFPTPIEHTHVDNWDLMVVAHEFGHTCGSVHTFNYSPPIDCEDGSGPDEGTLMSYCHGSGMETVGMRFHARVQQTLRTYLAAQTCPEVIAFQPGDYNYDGVLDEADLTAARMCVGLTFASAGCLEAFDMDGDGTLTRCDYAILKAGIDPSQAIVDCNDNGLPDVCEDCNGNGRADECDIEELASTDCDDNGVPDECEAIWEGDCNANGWPDFCDIVRGLSQDDDGNGVPDECQQLRIVPSADYPTIQSAIDAAEPVDVVLLEEGVYSGPGNVNLDPGGKILTVRSVSGPDACIIDGENSAAGFSFTSGESRASRIEGLTIRRGLAETGGGIHVSGGSSPTIADCVIEACEATLRGGGIFCDSGEALITNCRIRQNTASWGGGVYCLRSSARIKQCHVEDNDAGFGGAVYVSEGDPQVLDCRFVGNTAASLGGGVRLDFSSAPVIRRCTIAFNVAAEGGGISALTSQPIIDNCLITGNIAEVGGGVSLWRSSVCALRHCTMIDNVSTDDGGHALFVRSNAVNVLNTIMISSSPGYEIVGRNFSAITVQHCDIEDGEAAVDVSSSYYLTWGPGNVDVDPLFVDAAVADYRLSSGSPLIDAGDPHYLPGPQIHDHGGLPRRVDGDGDLLPVVDIGAHEYQAACIGDINGDGVVALSDLLLLLDAWGAEGDHPADVNRDGHVGSADLFLLLFHWGSCS